MSEAQLLENYLLGKLNPEDRLLMEAKLMLDKGLQEKAYWQNKTYALIKLHGRAQLKKEIEAVHEKLFREKRYEGFRKKITNLFK